jgi:NtrC-family two-component system sensor histidine kinase KinB
MKQSIRTKFTLGMIFLFIIISILCVFSGFYLNMLSGKTGAILKENYVSVVYAREMSDGLTNINQEITTSFLMKINHDSLKISDQLSFVDKSLQLEKRNITEPGEGDLVLNIETNYKEYENYVIKHYSTILTAEDVLLMQKKSEVIFGQLILLSQMNGKAIEIKTDDAKAASKNALFKMTILATLCFLIAFSFTFSFASYFNQRFYQLYNGIKQLVSSNFDQRLFFEGKDEFYEISLVFNEMAEKLNENKKKMSVTLLAEDPAIRMNNAEIEELKMMLFKLKSMEEQASALISRIEKK